MSAITEALCGTSCSKSHVSALVGRLDPELTAWRQRPLTAGADPYLMVDARDEYTRVAERVVTLGVLLVTGVRADGRREILAVAEADTESEATWRELFQDLKDRGLRGVELVTSDDHRGSRAAIEREFQGASWQRCQTHFSRNLQGLVARRHRARLGADLRMIFAAPARRPGGPAIHRWRPRWRPRWRTAWRGMPVPRNIGHGCGPRTAWNASTRSSNAGHGWCAFSPIGQRCCGS